MSESLKKQNSAGKPSDISDFLFAYRNSPHTVTQKSPSKRVLNRHVRIQLSNIKPNENTVINQNTNLKAFRFFKNDAKVAVKNHLTGQFEPGKILERVGKGYI